MPAPGCARRRRPSSFQLSLPASSPVRRFALGSLPNKRSAGSAWPNLCEAGGPAQSCKVEGVIRSRVKDSVPAATLLRESAAIWRWSRGQLAGRGHARIRPGQDIQGEAISEDGERCKGEWDRCPSGCDGRVHSWPRAGLGGGCSHGRLEPTVGRSHSGPRYSLGQWSGAGNHTNGVRFDGSPHAPDDGQLVHDLTSSFAGLPTPTLNEVTFPGGSDHAFPPVAEPTKLQGRAFGLPEIDLARKLPCRRQVESAGNRRWPPASQGTPVRAPNENPPKRRKRVLLLFPRHDYFQVSANGRRQASEMRMSERAAPDAGKHAVPAKEQSPVRVNSENQRPETGRGFVDRFRTHRYAHSG